MELRDYQKELLASIKRSLSVNKYVLATAPTGAGKTILSLAFIKEQIQQNKRVVFVVNREELIFQSLEKFKELEKDISILKAGHDHLFDSSKKIQIVMLQTWHARKIDDLNPDIIIIDEVHEGFGQKRISELLETFSEAKVLGLTATPIDEKGHLIEGFDDYIQDIQVSELIEEGFLVKPRILAPSSLDLSGVRISGNDYNQEDLDKLLIEVSEVENIVNQYKKHADGLKTIVFANSIAHAEALQDSFSDNGYNCAVLHSKIKNLNETRKILISKFKSGETPILINVGILTTGFDEGSVQCILLARPTKILRLYIQIAGRGLRICPEINKTECLFLDCANIVRSHGFPDTFRIFIPKPVKVDEVKVKEKICPQCETVVKIMYSDCPYCGFEFTGEPQPTVTKKEAKAMQELKNMQVEAFDMLKHAVALQNYSYPKPYLMKLLRDMVRIKPPKLAATFFYKKVNNICRQAIQYKFKPVFVIYKLRDWYKYTGELETTGFRKNVA